jgi:hypothetical protein
VVFDGGSASMRAVSPGGILASFATARITESVDFTYHFRLPVLDRPGGFLAARHQDRRHIRPRLQ